MSTTRSCSIPSLQQCSPCQTFERWLTTFLPQRRHGYPTFHPSPHDNLCLPQLSPAARSCSQAISAASCSRRLGGGPRRRCPSWVDVCFPLQAARIFRLDVAELVLRNSY